MEKLRIVVVQLDTAETWRLRQQLVRLGHTVVGEARETNQASEVILETQPDAALITVSLEETLWLDSLALIPSIRREDPLPVVIVSDHDDPKLAEHIGTSGAHGFLVLPVSDSELAWALTAAVARFAEREELCRLRAQTRRKAALLRLSAELAAAVDEDDICWRVVNGLHETLGYSFLGLLLLDETTSERVLRASVGWPDAPDNWRIPPGNGLSELPLLDGKLNYTPDVTCEPRYVPGLDGASEVDVPLQLGDDILGVLVAESEHPHAFSHDDFEVLSAAANQAAIAISKARLLAAERRRADELEALRATTADISSQLDLSSLLQDILKRAVLLLDATGGDLGLFDGARQEIEIVVSHNMGKNFAGTRQALGEGAMGRVAETGEPLIVQDYKNWEGRSPQYSQGPWHGVLVAPLVASDRLVGVIGIVDSDPSRQFIASDLRLLDMFAQQSAIAVEKARLFEESQRQTQELAALYDTALALGGVLETQALLTRLYTQVRQLMNPDSFGVFLYDSDAHELEIVLAIEENEAVSKAVGMRASLNEGGLTGWVIRTGRPLLIGDLQEDQLPIEPIHITRPARSWLGVPLIARDRLIGAISAQSFRPNAFGDGDRRLLESLAAQAAIAIENARYHQAVQEYAASLQVAACEKEQLLEQVQRHAATLEQEVAARTAEISAEKVKVEAILKSAGDAIVLTGPDNRISYVNDAFSALTGYSPEEVAGESTHKVFCTNHTPSATQKAIELAMTQGLSWRGDVWAVHRENRVIETEMTLAPVRDASDQILGFVAGLRDVSQARALERAKSEFLTNVSHQLRTPVTNLKTFAYLLSNGPPEKQAHYIEIMGRQVEKLTHLIQDVLEVAELDVGPIVTDWRPVSPTTLVTSAATRFRAQAEASGLALKVVLPAEPLPPILGSAHRLAQALNQIVENALLYTGEGQVVIGSHLVNSPALSSPELVLWVSDTGPGIPACEQELLFDRFFRGKASEPGHILGTGLGLSTAKMIIEAHRGRIEVQSELGQGTTFEVRLPVLDQANLPPGTSRSILGEEVILISAP